MNKYVGKICPYCKTEFQPDDDIVVCSICDMPHHKDCWIENQGCTTFGCLGTIKNPDGKETTVTTSEIQYEDTKESAFVYCVKCGAPNHKGNSFCGKCGASLSVQRVASDNLHYTVANDATSANPYAYVNNTANQYYQGSSFKNDNDAIVSALIGNNAGYYLQKFSQLKSSNSKSSWNWCAFLFTPYWMIYRKMYGYGVAVLAGAFFLNLLGGWLISLLVFAGYIVFGVLGNYIYMSFLEKKAQQIVTMNEPFRTQEIAQKGGTNVAATILTIVGYSILITIINSL